MNNEQAKQYFQKAEMLKNMVVSCATGGECDATDYSSIRAEFLAHQGIAGRLPKFIKTCRNLREFWDFIQPMFPSYRERRRFIREEFDPLLSMLESVSKSPADEAVTEQVLKVDSAHVQQAWEKALDRRGNDPDGAITAARTLLETVCKHVLDEEGVTYDEKADLSKLYNLVANELSIAPSQQTLDILKQITSGCISVVTGLGALRNKLGDSHGKGKEGISVDPRLAHLAVNLAGAMAMYLIETWEGSSDERESVSSSHAAKEPEGRNRH